MVLIDTTAGSLLSTAWLPAGDRNGKTGPASHVHRHHPISIPIPSFLATNSNYGTIIPQPEAEGSPWAWFWQAPILRRVQDHPLWGNLRALCRSTSVRHQRIRKWCLRMAERQNEWGNLRATFCSKYAEYTNITDKNECICQQKQEEGEHFWQSKQENIISNTRQRSHFL